MIRQFTVDHFWFIVEAFRWTIALSVVAFIGGAIVGLGIALAAVSARRPVRWVARAYIELFQGTPLLMQMFTAYFGVGLLGLAVDAWISVSVALILNSAAFFGEIWRGCIQAIPASQSEAAFALGLKRWHTMRLVILPQALKIAVAPTIGFLVQIVKGTSLASIVNFVEVMRAGQIVNNVTFKPAIVFTIVVVLYFSFCFPLSLISRALERRLGVGHTRVQTSV